ncbi:hypothetical protein JCGZ_11949 [Jatropha curcas]|uniref:Uncharacterized protein n=1 Tax=Jatropha curcas TaxID=180498 RepID=A0A067KEH1_JATCU|nr:hypothetical protein JCGZ_11949 [Jatropha curcas]
MRIIKLHLDKDGYTWNPVPQEARDFYWEEFQKHFVWEEAITAMLKWLGRNCALYGMLTSLMGFEKAVRSSNACLRRYGRAGRRLGRILHSRESVRYLHETGAAEKYGREPTSMEVFTYTHTKDHDGNTFVNRRALGVNERQLAELRANVMRMSSQHDAGTSSSNPLPAIDRHVSTALHQPLSSPLDPDTADDTLVTPADTTTHPANTPADATTLDRAKDRPRRFDFGPF